MAVAVLLPRISKTQNPEDPPRLRGSESPHPRVRPPPLKMGPGSGSYFFRRKCRRRLFSTIQKRRLALGLACQRGQHCIGAHRHQGWCPNFNLRTPPKVPTSVLGIGGDGDDNTVFCWRLPGGAVFLRCFMHDHLRWMNLMWFQPPVQYCLEMEIDFLPSQPAPSVLQLQCTPHQPFPRQHPTSTSTTTCSTGASAGFPLRGYDYIVDTSSG